MARANSATFLVCMTLAHNVGAKWFNRHYGKDGIVFTSCHPGNLRTGLTRDWNKGLHAVLVPIVKSVVLYPQEMGCISQLYLNTAPEAESKGGAYYVPWAREAEPMPQASDEKIQESCMYTRLCSHHSRYMGRRTGSEAHPCLSRFYAVLRSWPPAYWSPCHSVYQAAAALPGWIFFFYFIVCVLILHLIGRFFIFWRHVFFPGIPVLKMVFFRHQPRVRTTPPLSMAAFIALFQSDLKRVATVSSRPDSLLSQLFFSDLDSEPA